MKDDDLLKITDSIQEKVGKENSAAIADDLGMLITKNAEALKTISDKEKQIEELKSKNEKLVIANGNLLQQIPVGDVDDSDTRGHKEEQPEKPFSMKACFDARGNFIQ